MRCDHALGSLKDAHDDGPGIGQDEDGSRRFEHPLEEHEGIHIPVQVVLFDDHVDEFIGHDKSQDKPGDRNDDRGGQVADHVIHPGIPTLGCHAHLGCDFAYTGIDVIK
jgi:hypothetical protein